MPHMSGIPILKVVGCPPLAVACSHLETHLLSPSKAEAPLNASLSMPQERSRRIDHELGLSARLLLAAQLQVAAAVRQ